MQKISVYLNHLASHSNYDYWKQSIEGPLFRSKIEFHRPRNFKELNLKLRDDVKNKVDVIISVGGDGTVHSIIQQLVGSNDIGVLVIPAGTANDLASELGNGDLVKKVVQSVRSKDFKFIDLIRVNNSFMATNGGIGLGGDVANKINILRKKYPIFRNIMKHAGDSVYKVFTGFELLKPSSDYYSLKIDSEEFVGDLEVAALLINNQKTLGGKFKIAPFTDNSDGKFNVTALAHPNRLSLMKAVASISKGQFPENDPHIISFETKKLKIYNNDSRNTPLFFGDGEILGKGDQYWEIDIFPAALKVYSKTGNIEYENVKNEVFLQ